ncbi:hypothetical protein D3C80_2088530 [compost metagenome]
MLCQGSELLFDQPLPRSPSSVLDGVCIGKKEENCFLIKNSVLGAVLVSFEASVDLSVGEAVFVCGELHIDSALIKLGVTEVNAGRHQ